MHSVLVFVYARANRLSLSEYGCIKNRPRKFGELEPMMSSQMSEVYSGGLMYEYSIEDNEFGIVTLKGDDVKTGDEYDNFKSALSEYPMPTGDGGAASTTHSVDCPTSEALWQVDPSLIPEMPEQAQKYMDDGAGTGPGIKGKGSQSNVDSGIATANVTVDGSASTGTSSSSSDNDDDDDSAASMQVLSMSSLCVSGAAIFFALFGTLLL